MSGWVTFLLVCVGLSMPRERRSAGPWIAWALVTLGLLAALLVDAKGWP